MRTRLLKKLRRRFNIKVSYKKSIVGEAYINDTKTDRYFLMRYDIREILIFIIAITYDRSFANRMDLSNSLKRRDIINKRKYKSLCQ